MKVEKKFILLGLILLLGFVADFASKQWVLSNVKGEGSVVILDGYLEFSYVENRGMVFGFLNEQSASLKHYALTGMTLVAMAAILFMIWRIRSLPFFYHLPFFLVLGGALGNLVDRLRFGFVVDFIHMHWRDVLDYPWHYNVADALIVVGMILLFVIVLFRNDVLEQAMHRKSETTLDSVPSNESNPA